MSSSITSVQAVCPYKQIQARAFFHLYISSSLPARPDAKTAFIAKWLTADTFAGPKTHSRLIINDVIKEDEGNYSCSAPNTESSSIDVYVSPGIVTEVQSSFLLFSKAQSCHHKEEQNFDHEQNHEFIKYESFLWTVTKPSYQCGIFVLWRGIEMSVFFIEQHC